MRTITVICVIFAATVIKPSTASEGKREEETELDRIKVRADDLLSDTVSDIKEKSKKFKHDVETNSEGFTTSVVSYVNSVVKDIVSFIKMLFGDDSPGQPAIAPRRVEEEAGMMAPPTVESSNILQKLTCLLLLGMIARWAMDVTNKYVKGRKSMNVDHGTSYYKNLSETDLVENFL